MVVVGGVVLRLPELLLMLLPPHVLVLGTVLADGHGAMHQRGWRGGGGWRRIIDYHVLHWDVIVLQLPAGQPVSSIGFHLLLVRRSPVPKSAGARGSHGGSGVHRRKGTEVDDCGYGRRNSLHSNCGW